LTRHKLVQRTEQHRIKELAKAKVKRAKQRSKTFSGGSRHIETQWTLFRVWHGIEDYCC